MNVQFLLRIVISEEIERMDSCLELTAPLIDTFWSTELLQRFLNQKISMEIHHIVCFDALGAAGDINLHNLECFCHILPISLLSRQQYHPYYYYANSITSRYANPFPYFAVVHNCVVLLSEDGTCAMLLRDPEHGIGLFTTRQFPTADNLCSVWIRESNLCRAFHGWLTHLPGSNLTMSAQESATILKELVHVKE